MNTFYVQIGRNTRSGNMESFVSMAVNSDNSQQQVHKHFKDKYQGLEVKVSPVDTLSLDLGPNAEPAPYKPKPDPIFYTGAMELPDVFKDDLRAVSAKRQELDTLEKDVLVKVKEYFCSGKTLFKGVTVNFIYGRVTLEYKHDFIPREPWAGE